MFLTLLGNWCHWRGFYYKVEKAKEADSPLNYLQTEIKLDQLISGCNRKYACFLQLLKESAFLVGEAMS